MTRPALAFGLSAVLTLAAAAPVLAAPTDATPAKVLTQGMPSIPGPRRTIAVGNFDLMGPAATPSATNVGGPIAALMETALSECDCVTVVERDAVAQIINEMDLAKSNVTTGSSAPKPGNMIPAQYLVVGSITDYTASGAATGNGGGFSIGGSTALTLGGSSGDVAIDVRLVDTTTGVVIKTFKVRRKLSSMNVGLSSSYKGIPVATNGFFNTPLGDATRRALTDAVLQIDQTLAAIPWRGQVVKADGGQLYVNAGAEAGVRVGDQLTVERVGETLTDPATGAVLKQDMMQLGVVTITDSEPKYAVGSYKPIATGDPARGDYVVAQP